MVRILLAALLLCSCSGSYRFIACDALQNRAFEYELLSIEPFNDSLYKAHVFLDFLAKDSTSNDVIACAIIDVCRLEGLIEAYFYWNRDCLILTDSTISNLDINLYRELFDCYIGRVKQKPTQNWRKTLSQDDIEFFLPLIQFEF